MSFVEFSQREELTTRIRNILDDYPQGITILKEFLQNADDAAATNFAVCLDLRTYNSGDRFLHPNLSSFSGPALLVYNSSVFSEKDFQSITSIGQSGKRDDASKVGKYGLGFNASYHISDVVQFMSNDQLVLFDPHGKHLPRELLGLRAQCTTEFVEKYPDTMKPFYEGAVDAFSAGQDLLSHSHNLLSQTTKQVKDFNGTVFRLPLRTPAMAQKSLLSSTSHSVADMVALLDSFAAVASEMLLFLSHVQSIELSILPPDPKSRPVLLHRTTVLDVHPVAPLGKSLPSLSTTLSSTSASPRRALATYVHHQTRCCDTSDDNNTAEAFRSAFELRIDSVSYASAVSFGGDESGSSGSGESGDRNSGSGSNSGSNGSNGSNGRLDHMPNDNSTNLVSYQKKTTRWLIHNGADSSDIALQKSKRADQLPWAGIAVLLESRTEETKETEKTEKTSTSSGQSSSKTSTSALPPFEGRAYCFLPLPILTGLPCHVNAAFAVSSNRRQLWSRSSGDNIGTGSWKGDWNAFLMRRLLPTLFSEAVAICARQWREGHVMNRSINYSMPLPVPSPTPISSTVASVLSSSWLFDAVWPKPDKCTSGFDITATSMIQMLFRTENIDKIFFSLVSLTP